MEWQEIIILELSNDELVHDALGINFAHDFDLKVNQDSIDVDDVAPPIVKLSVAKCHVSLLFSFFLHDSL